MKIIHIGNIKSGIETYVRNTVSLADDRFEFVIIKGADDNTAPFIRNEREVKSYSISMYRALNPIKDFKAVLQAYRIIKKEKPDLVHCHSAKGGVIGRIAAFLAGKKSCYTPHAFSFLSTNSSLKHKIFVILEKISKVNSFLLACSDSEKALGMKTLHYNENNAFSWPNAIPPIDVKSIKNSSDIKIVPKYILSIGRPSYQKNPLLMVEIMNEIHKTNPDINFFLVGVGYYSPMLDEMKSLIKEYGLEGVIKLVPWCSREDALFYLKNSLFYLSTSLYEGLPIALLEAMALEKPIVATNVIGNNDCIENGFNGFLCNLDKESLLQKCLLLINDDKLRSEMEHNAIDLFNQKFNLYTRINELETIYSKIINA